MKKLSADITRWGFRQLHSRCSFKGPVATFREAEAGQMLGRDRRTLYIVENALGYRERVSGSKNSRAWTGFDYMARRTRQGYTEELHDHLVEERVPVEDIALALENHDQLKSRDDP